MPGVFQLQLDTTGPQDPTLTLDVSGPTFTLDRVVTAILGTSSTDATKVKLWGDVDPAADARIQTLEVNSSWISLANIDLTVTAGDAVKTIYARLSDDLGNTSSVASDTIVLDSTAPTVSIDAGPTSTAGGAPPRISKVAGFDDGSVTWHANEDIQAYKIKFVPATGSLHTEGVQIPTAGGSTGVNVASDGSVKLAANAQVTSHVRGADLDAAAANGDGTKQLKIFAQDMAGNWSVL